MEFKVEGMVCTGCENRICNALSMVDGVKKVKANHKKGIVKVVLTKEISQDEIINKISSLGFNVVK